MFLASTHGEKYQQDQKPTHAERFSNQEKYSNQTRSDSRFVTSNNDPKEDDIPGPKCMVAYFNQDVPQGHVRVRSRTCYVGNVNADVNLENLRAAFETVGRVETIALNFDKYNAFVKMYTRAEAEDAIQKMNRFSIGSSVLKVNWGCGCIFKLI